MVTFIIWIMYINHIRPAFLKVVIIIVCYRYIFRIQIPFIMCLPQAPVRVPVKIRYGNHISIAVRVFLCRLPHAFKGIPHGCFIWKKYNFYPGLDVFIQVLFYLCQRLMQYFNYSVHTAPLSLPDIFMYLVNKLAVVFQQRYHPAAFSFCLFNQFPKLDRSLLTLFQQFHRYIVFTSTDCFPYCLMGTGKQFQKFYGLAFLCLPHAPLSPTYCFFF